MTRGQGRVQIGTTMRNILAAGDCIDPQTGEVNCTRLAEAAAEAFGLEEVPDRFFDIAAEFDNTGPLCSAVQGLINSLDSSWF